MLGGPKDILECTHVALQKGGVFLEIAQWPCLGSRALRYLFVTHSIRAIFLKPHASERLASAIYGIWPTTRGKIHSDSLESHEKHV